MMTDMSLTFKFIRHADRNSISCSIGWVSTSAIPKCSHSWSIIATSTIAELLRAFVKHFGIVDASFIITCLRAVNIGDRRYEYDPATKLGWCQNEQDIFNFGQNQYGYWSCKMSRLNWIVCLVTSFLSAIVLGAISSCNWIVRTLLDHNFQLQRMKQIQITHEQLFFAKHSRVGLTKSSLSTLALPSPATLTFHATWYFLVCSQDLKIELRQCVILHEFSQTDDPL